MSFRTNIRLAKLDYRYQFEPKDPEVLTHIEHVVGNKPQLYGCNAWTLKKRIWTLPSQRVTNPGFSNKTMNNPNWSYLSLEDQLCFHLAISSDYMATAGDPLCMPTSMWKLLSRFNTHRHPASEELTVKDLYQTLENLQALGLFELPSDEGDLVTKFCDFDSSLRVSSTWCGVAARSKPVRMAMLKLLVDQTASSTSVYNLACLLNKDGGNSADSQCSWSLMEVYTILNDLRKEHLVWLDFDEVSLYEPDASPR